MNYNVTLTEEEMNYLRSALCDKNMKHNLKMFKCRDEGYTDGEEHHKYMLKIGHDLQMKLEIASTNQFD